MNSVILLTFGFIGVGVATWLFVRHSGWLLVAAPVFILASYLLVNRLPVPTEIDNPIEDQNGG